MAQHSETGCVIMCIRYVKMLHAKVKELYNSNSKYVLWNNILFDMLVVLLVVVL